jgi:phage FluMu protein Com
MTVTELPIERIEIRACPHCGHVVTQLAIEDMRINPKCPRCKRAKYSEFTPRAAL